jgi:hypothetical protein
MTSHYPAVIIRQNYKPHASSAFPMRRELYGIGVLIGV